MFIFPVFATNVTALVCGLANGAVFNKFIILRIKFVFRHSFSIDWLCDIY